MWWNLKPCSTTPNSHGLRGNSDQTETEQYESSGAVEASNANPQAILKKTRHTKVKKRLTISALMLCCGLLAFHLAPLPSSLQQHPLSKVLLAKDGQLLAAKIASDQQWRFPQTHNLPPKYITAVTTFEDRYFNFHPGINPISIGRAFMGNLKAGRVTSGGSTITMQLARLIQDDPPRTYKNKIIEIFLALKLEWHFSKTEILSLYASEAPFGGNTVGIGAASWRYFGRYLKEEQKENSREKIVSISRLSWAEAALLAVLPNSPALMHPGRARPKLKAKRDRLLTTLRKQNKITKNEHDLSVLEPLPQKPNRIPRHAPHLLQTLMQRYPNRDLIQSTIDADLQKKVSTLAKFQGRQLASEGVHNLSIIVINNQDMTTPAYLGNVTTADNKILYGSDIDIAIKPRSTGSVLKPLLYGLMLQAGDILPNTLVPDIPTNYQGFTPENYDHKYRGAVPAKEALARSLNIPAVRMLKKYGVSRFHHDLQQLGMSTLFRSSDDYGLSLILGGAEGNLWELTSIYAQLLNTARQGWNSGSQKQPALISNIETSDAAKQKHSAHKKTPLLSQGAAWLALDALHEVVRPGSENLWREFTNSQKIAWKTGTSYGLRDAWAIGSNGKYTVGIWAGNAGGEAAAGLSGVRTAAPLMFQIFDVLGNSQWISKPEFDLKEVITCKDDGYLTGNRCESEISLAPVNSHFQDVTPFHKKVQLDRDQKFRVHGGCERVANSIIKNWLILPPAQEYYWRKNHGEFRDLPPWRSDCIAELANYSDEMPMDVIYPQEGAKIYIPIELDGKKGRVVFQATHRNHKAKLFWHVDNHFIKETELFHDVELDLAPGWHKLILIDELGFTLSRWFRVLGRESR